MLIGFHIPEALAARPSSRSPGPTPPQGAEINAWLAIDAEGNVTVRVPHTEMGQGALTSVAMMIAEELNVDWSRVRAVFADANRHLRNDNEYMTMYTAGSALVRRQHPHIMQAGASARERLKEAAARAWGVDRGAVEAKLGELKSGTHSGTYAEFATAAAAITLPEEPAIKTPDQWWLLGKPLKRLDVDVKSNGSAVYAIDVRVPDMVYAAVKACPVPWGGAQELRRQRDQAIVPASSPRSSSRRCRARLRSPTCRTPSPSWPIAGIARRPRSIRCPSNGTTARTRMSAPSRSSPRRGGYWISRGRWSRKATTRSPCSAAANKVVTAEYHRP